MITPFPTPRDRGVVLANTLALVLMIAAIAATLLSRAEASRERAAILQTSFTTGHTLDALSDFALSLMANAGADGAPVDERQSWADDTGWLELGESRARIEIVDLQGRLNINWLAVSPPDPYATASFERLFYDLGLPPELLAEITAFLGPITADTAANITQLTPPTHHPTGPIPLLDALRDVPGVTPDQMASLSPHVTALPADTRLNLNTASPTVLRAALHPFPPEVQTAFQNRLASGPIDHLSIFRDITVAALESEAIEHLPFDRFSLSSRWFQAGLQATRDGQEARRWVVFHRTNATDDTARVVMRWSPKT